LTSLLKQLRRAGQLNQRPFAAGIVNSIAGIEAGQSVAGRDYQFSVLRIPGIYLIALWLKDTQGNSDAIVPVAPRAAGVGSGAGLLRRSVHGDARGMAERRLAFDNSPRG
jgi:hypothetical protein